jgi:hypothetical protein
VVGGRRSYRRIGPAILPVSHADVPSLPVTFPPPHDRNGLWVDDVSTTGRSDADDGKRHDISPLLENAKK